MNDRRRFGKQYGYKVLFKGQDRKASGKAGAATCPCPPGLRRVRTRLQSKGGRG